ncbi:MAG: hypothetical protein AAGF94_17270 [Pseudomonadota bacterium]
MADFTKYRYPVLAVPCPDCRKAAGVWCMRPSGHRASDLHAARCDAADQDFIDQHGADASIERTGTGWQIDPTGRAARNRVERDRPQQFALI